jgi:DNA-binding MurR/RpiR family transcriptional regulator
MRRSSALRKPDRGVARPSAPDPRAVGPRIRMMLPGLSPFEGRIAEFLMRVDFDDTVPLKEVADAAGVSEAMVVKTAKKLGFDGFRELRAALAEYKRLPAVDLHREVTPEDTAETILQKVFRTSIQALEETLAILDVEALQRTADLIHGSRQRDLYGLGGSAQIARDVAHKFLRIGIRTSVFDDSHMMAMSASLLGPGDLAVAFSHSGRSAGLVDAVRLAKDNGASIIAVSNYDTGPIASLADAVLCSTALGSPLTGENAAARIAQLNIMDAVFVAVAQKGYAAAEQNLARTMAAVEPKRR